uniref:Uncharacterized protein n=1 Tax=Poecilia latipinna TaxID=48699 RepID=A0A3B3UVP2_9TELE
MRKKIKIQRKRSDFSFIFPLALILFCSYLLHSVQTIRNPSFHPTHFQSLPPRYGTSTNKASSGMLLLPPELALTRLL